MRSKLPLLLATLLMLVPLANAQTINFKLGAHGCNNFNGTYYCDNIPVTNLDGSWPEPNNSQSGSAPFVFSDVLYNGRLNGFFMLTNYDLDGGTVTAYSVTTLATTPVSYQLDVKFNGVLYSNPSIPWTGDVSYIYTIGTRHCVGRACSTPWNILGGTGTVTIGSNAPRFNPTPDSPTAPTPVCLPGDANGCPHPHDL